VPQNAGEGSVQIPQGRGFIEVHHMKPLSSIDEEVVVNPETNLVPLCSNCHRMLHRKQDGVFFVEELKEKMNTMRLTVSLQ